MIRVMIYIGDLAPIDDNRTIVLKFQNTDTGAMAERKIRYSSTDEACAIGRAVFEMAEALEDVQAAARTSAAAHGKT